MIGELLDEGHSATDIASALIHLLNSEKPRPQDCPEAAPEPDLSNHPPTSSGSPIAEHRGDSP